MTLVFRDLYRTMIGQPFRVVLNPLEDIRTEAQALGLTIQLVEGQRRGHQRHPGQRQVKSLQLRYNFMWDILPPWDGT